MASQQLHEVMSHSQHSLFFSEEKGKFYQRKYGYIMQQLSVLQVLCNGFCLLVSTHDIPAFSTGDCRMFAGDAIALTATLL